MILRGHAQPSPSGGGFFLVSDLNEHVWDRPVVFHDAGTTERDRWRYPDHPALVGDEMEAVAAVPVDVIRDNDVGCPYVRSDLPYVSTRDHLRHTVQPGSAKRNARLSRATCKPLDVGSRISGLGKKLRLAQIEKLSVDLRYRCQDFGCVGIHAGKPPWSSDPLLSGETRRAGSAYQTCPSCWCELS